MKATGEFLESLGFERCSQIGECWFIEIGSVYVRINAGSGSEVTQEQVTLLVEYLKGLT